MIRSWPSVLIGLGIPALAILVVTPLLSGTAVSVAGIPLLFFWMFCCFPLTTLCLWVSWRFFDRHHYPADRRTAQEDR
ncbi:MULTISPECIES: DUF3311 domain-containing protein [Amycolatopsis]|uniref:DUF3311 domain-containing protein n=1 Tax=Amycolatopsis thermalba TaxID=944492 RepID=A0ABY4NZ25_9PSEU|nr:MULTISPECIES: DUF3311 domain-containing protein [Amycolatopsis]OXM75161.1 hypothetical protein CF166_00790 [Amycolatopsis sp. KNN50.9b]UQS25247.1 DUF3311 domain-containing protein [Amycolatopsis thermalba]